LFPSRSARTAALLLVYVPMKNTITSSAAHLLADISLRIPWVEQVVQTVLTGHNRDRVMSSTFNSEIDPSQPMVYQIRIKGHLGRQWTNWFSGLTITLDNGETLLTGSVVDQAALHGVLKKVRDLGLPLLSVNHVKPGR
jgi:hypothetical protein